MPRFLKWFAGVMIVTTAASVGLYLVNRGRLRHAQEERSKAFEATVQRVLQHYAEGTPEQDDQWLEDSLRSLVDHPEGIPFLQRLDKESPAIALDESYSVLHYLHHSPGAPGKPSMSSFGTLYYVPTPAIPGSSMGSSNIGVYPQLELTGVDVQGACVVVEFRVLDVPPKERGIIEEWGLTPGGSYLTKFPRAGFELDPDILTKNARPR